jgi:hypothetical protein
MVVLLGGISLHTSAVAKKIDETPLNYESKQEIQEFKEKTKARNTKYKDEKQQKKTKYVMASINFSRILPLEDVKELIKKYNLVTEYIFGRQISKNSNGVDENRTKISSSVDETNTLDDINQYNESMAQTFDMNFLGYINIGARVPSNKIENLERDERIYLVDTRANTYFEETIPGMILSGMEKSSDIPDYPNEIYYHLENLRLVPTEGLGYSSLPELNAAGEIVKEETMPVPTTG